MGAGDWIEIPLTKEFNYDVLRNLVTDLSCDMGTSFVDLRGSFSSIRYVDRMAYNNLSNTSDVPENTYDLLIDFRMWLK